MKLVLAALLAASASAGPGPEPSALDRWFDGARARTPFVEPPAVDAAGPAAARRVAASPKEEARAAEPPAPGRAPIDVAWLHAQARRLFETNRVTEVREWEGKPKRACTYHAPSLPYNRNMDHYYPHQWLWDSLAHSIVLSYLEPEEAKEEIRSILYTQRDDGFLPHMVWNKDRMRGLLDKLHAKAYPSKRHSAFTQPPLIAEAVERIYRETGDLEFVREAWPGLVKYYGWLDRTRQGVAGGPDDGLNEIIGSDESGMDNGPEYDRLYRGPFGIRLPMNLLKLRYKLTGWDDRSVFGSNIFRVKDLFFNSIYATNLRSMAVLGEALGDAPAAAEYRRLASVTERSLMEKSWDPETRAFYSLDARHNRDERLDDRITVSSLMPLVLDDIPRERVDAIVDGLLYDQDKFWARFPIPSEPRDFYRGLKKPEHGIWRGSQTWIFPVRYVVKGLLKQAGRFPGRAEHYRKVAQELTCRAYDAVRRSGFREYYDAESGAGDGASNFGWSTLVVDMVHSVGDTRCD